MRLSSKVEPTLPISPSDGELADIQVERTSGVDHVGRMRPLDFHEALAVADVYQGILQCAQSLFDERLHGGTATFGANQQLFVRAQP